jgi:2-phospho-L-lactate guanylyltransferase
MIAAVVPVKRLEEAKKRLSGFLSSSERRRICLAMLFDVLDNLERVRCIDEVYIVTPDEQVEVLVCDRCENVRTIREPIHSDLNGALHHATCRLEERGVSGVLVLPGDVPLVKAYAMERILCNDEAAQMIVVPDKTCRGTNLLFFHTPFPLKPCFGPDSFGTYRKQAAERGISYSVFSAECLHWDIDTPRDIAAVLSHGRGTRTYRELCMLGIDKRFKAGGFSGTLTEAADEPVRW